ncbi:MAG: hypothetical protein LUC86_01470 [Prevotellaceae bacterium]|nr:hypothetical protein [Prevotellaceae bacterium]
MIDAADALLADKTESAAYALFWFHRTGDNFASLLNKLSLADPSARSDFIQPDTDSYAGVLNNAVVSLAFEDFESAVKYYSMFFEDSLLIQDFRNTSRINKTVISNKELVRRFISILVRAYPDVEWLPYFTQFSDKKSVLGFIKGIFEELATAELNTLIDTLRQCKADTYDDWLTFANKLKEKINKHIDVLKPADGRTISAEGQIVLDKLCAELICECRNYYRDSKSEDEFSVLPTLELVNYALSLAAGNDVLETGNNFKKELEQDIHLLPPECIRSDADDIKQKIKEYCERPDEIQWSLVLVKACIPILKQIRSKVGATNAYYINISTKIADNALYNCAIEVNQVTRTGNTYSADVRKKVLRSAWELILYLNKLDISEDFRHGKLHSLEVSVKAKLDLHKIDCSNINVDVVLLTDEELLEQCKDYNSITAFCIYHPSSPVIGKAIQKKWEYEISAYPTDITVRTLLTYKRNYPNSHRDPIVFAGLERLLSDESKWTINDYREFLRLYPNYKERSEILNRIDTISFNQCKTLDDYQKYLSEFGDGAYRKQAKDKIDEIIYNACNTEADLKQYIANNPAGKHVESAKQRIEDILYKEALAIGSYDLYLKVYPAGRYVNDLLKRKDKECFAQCQTTKDYKNYLHLYPKGVYSDLTKQIIQKKRLMPTFGDMRLRMPNIIRRIPLWGIILFAAVLIILVAEIITPAASLTKKTDDYNPETTEEMLYDEDPEEEDDGIGDEDKDYENDYSENISNIKRQPTEEEEWGNNQLSTGAKPYSSYLGREQTGDNYLSFKTRGDCDYIIIVRRASDNKYINHIYIRGGANAKMYLPDGHYYVYFYSGKGWNPNKMKGNLTGGFVSMESQEKDGPIDLVSAWCEYTLYPVSNGNLTLESANEDEMFN